MIGGGHSMKCLLWVCVCVFVLAYFLVRMCLSGCVSPSLMSVDSKGISINTHQHTHTCDDHLKYKSQFGSISTMQQHLIYLILKRWLVIRLSQLLLATRPGCFPRFYIKILLHRNSAIGDMITPCSLGLSPVRNIAKYVSWCFSSKTKSSMSVC